MAQPIQHTFLAKPCLDLCAGYLSEDPRAIHGLLKYFRQLNPKSLVGVSSYMPQCLSEGLQETYDDERFDEVLLEGSDQGAMTHLKSRIVRVDLSHHTSETLLDILPCLSSENQQRVMLQAHLRSDFLEQCSKLVPTVCQDRRIYLAALQIVQTNGQVLPSVDKEDRRSIAKLLYSVRNPQIASIAQFYYLNGYMATRFGHLDFMINYLGLINLDFNDFIGLIHEAVRSKQLSILTLLVNEFNSRNFDEDFIIHLIFEDAIRSGSVEIVQTLSTMSIYNHVSTDTIFEWAQLSIDLNYIGITFFLININELRISLPQFVTLFTSVKSVAMFQMLADDSRFMLLSPEQLGDILLRVETNLDILRHFFKIPHVKNNLWAVYIAKASLAFCKEEDIALLQACKNYDAISSAKLFNILMQLFKNKGDNYIIQILKSKQVAKFSQQQLEALFKVAIKAQHWEVVKFFTTSPHMNKLSLECLNQSVVDARNLGDLDMMAILYRYLKKKSLKPLFN